MAQEAKVVNPDRQSDCTGLFCPMPIVQTREALTQMATGQILSHLAKLQSEGKVKLAGKGAETTIVA